jgi:hypothetical protein
MEKPTKPPKGLKLFIARNVKTWGIQMQVNRNLPSEIESPVISNANSVG